MSFTWHVNGSYNTLLLLHVPRSHQMHIVLRVELFGLIVFLAVVCARFINMLYLFGRRCSILLLNFALDRFRFGVVVDVGCCFMFFLF